MDQPTQVVAAPAPAPVARPHDPLAVAIGNASLLGVGYVLLGRRRLAVITGLVTVVLVALLVSVARSVWFEVVVALWWAALVVHGWLLAGGRTNRGAVRGERLVALGITVPVLLAAGLMRADAFWIERTVNGARHSGDCPGALGVLDRLWLGHRMVDAPMTARGDRTVEACDRLRVAADKLDAALTGDIDALKAGFDGLTSVLTEQPGHQKMVDVVLDGFLNELPTKNNCETAAITDWLRQRKASGNALDRSAGVVARTAPTALVGCADDFMVVENWEQARTRYQQMLDQYPGQELTTKAQEGVKQATLAIELANVRGLLQGPTSTQPEYCSKPAQYSGAAPYQKGTNHALYYGNDDYTKRLPGGWRATDVTKAVLVVCAGTEEYGATVRTCPYENKLSKYVPIYVKFHKIAIPVKAYELRTGKLVVNTKVQINGKSCPRVLTYTHYSGLIDIGPPSDVYVNASDADVRAAFQSMINR